MKIFVPRESNQNETRIPVIPAGVDRLVKLGAVIDIEAGLGAALGYADEAYAKAGAAIVTDRKLAFGEADMLLRLNVPPSEDLPLLKKGAIHVSHLDPFNQKDLLQAFAERGVSAISMEMIPRTTIAQKMDALSSQANLGGYVAVILAAHYSTRILPMMMTPAGTITPARVFVIGAGVAGLQAIATAKRLGARVEAFDTRPVVEEQVKSLAARFVKIDLGGASQTKDGYAKALTEEQLQQQRDGLRKVCSQSDVVITTAQVFGRRAPLIVTADMVTSMNPGSIIVDMAVETGGNVEGSRLNEVTDVGGVQILGFGNLPGRVPVPASQMYSSNLCNLVDHFWDKETKMFPLNREDEIIRGCLITHEGQVVHPTFGGK